MSLKSGFYNSMNGDRKYNATDMSSLFDGLINDGVFMSVGSNFAVTADSGNTVIVGTGRAWFNHTWTYNDAVMNVYLDDSDMIQDRIDAIVLEVNSKDSVRNNTIKVINGTASSSPVNPTLVNEEMIHQYPLAYINRPANSKEISQVDITNAVGTSECPFVTGIIDVNNIDVLVAQWQAKFDTWFEGVKGKLDGDTAGKLSNEILTLNEKVDEHNIKSIVGEEGVHNLRIINNKIQNKNNEEWENIDIGAKILKDNSSIGTLDKVKYSTNDTVDISFFHGGIADYSNYNSLGSAKLKDKIYTFLYYSSASSGKRVPYFDILSGSLKGYFPYDTPMNNIVSLGDYIYMFSGTTAYKFNGSTFTKMSDPPFNTSLSNAITYNDKIYFLGNSESNGTGTNFFYSFDGESWSVLTSPSIAGRYIIPIVCEDGIHYLGRTSHKYDGTYCGLDHLLFNGSTWSTLSNIPSTITDGSSSVSNAIIIKDVLYVMLSNYEVDAWDIKIKCWLNSRVPFYKAVNNLKDPMISCRHYNDIINYSDNEIIIICDYINGSYRCKRLTIAKNDISFDGVSNGHIDIPNSNIWKSFSGNLYMLPKCNEVLFIITYGDYTYNLNFPYEYLKNNLFNDGSVEHIKSKWCTGMGSKYHGSDYSYYDTYIEAYISRGMPYGICVDINRNSTTFNTIQTYYR